MRILLIDDDARLAELLVGYFEPQGVGLVHAAGGQAGLAQLANGGFDAVLLDVMMPGLDGLAVLRKIRDAGHRVPVIMLTARGEEAERVRGLSVGADDYVVKPFSMRELVLRVGSLLRSRRNLQALPPHQLTAPRHYLVGALEVDVDACRAFVDGVEIHLSAMEIRLLFYLLEHLGQVRSREALLEDVWGYSPEASTRTIDTHVKRLREKLGSAGTLIQTVRGTGYRLSRERTIATTEDA